MTSLELQENYRILSPDQRQELEAAYLNKTFVLGSGEKINFTKDDVMKIVLTYHRMIDFTKEIYHNQILKSPRKIDFEVSIDETSIPTSPQAHYFVAAELIRLGVDFVSLAPRFIGEFQKGIDYKGDLREFEEDFIFHAAIADHFGIGNHLKSLGVKAQQGI